MLQSGKTTMTLLNVTYASKFNFNLILLGQLRKSGILCHDHLNFIVLKQGGSTLRIVNKHKNLFVLKTGLKAKAILVKKKRQTHLLAQ